MKEEKKTNKFEDELDGFEKEYYSNLAQIDTTRSQEKMRNYLDRISKKDFFQSTISKLRKDFSIPENGFENGHFRIPPKGWVFSEKHYFSDKTYSVIVDSLRELCKKYKLPEDCWDIFEEYLFYGGFSKFHVSTGLVTIRDNVTNTEEPYGREIESSHKENYPISIEISPYAKERDVINFLNKTYKKIIEPLQNHYKDKNCQLDNIRTKRSKEAQERDEIVHQNRNLSAKKIKEILKEKGHKYHDETYIATIKRRQIKERQ